MAQPRQLPDEAAADDGHRSIQAAACESLKP